MAYAQNPEAEEVIVLLKKVGVGPLRRWLMLSRIRKHQSSGKPAKNTVVRKGEREDEDVMVEA